MKKKIGLILLSIPVVLALVVLLVLGYFGYIPGLSSLLGANKPRDLGVRYTEADLTSGRAKSQIKYESLPAEVPVMESVKYVGSREVKTSFTSAEITASMNNQPYKYWPFKDTQIKFNGDGSMEISGVLLKDKAKGFGAFIELPKEVVDTAMRLLPPDPAYYVKGQFAVKDNQVAVFEPQAFSIGKVSLPVGIFLSLEPIFNPMVAYAATVSELEQELDKVQNKKAWIISYINSRIAATDGLDAKDAHFEEDKFVFDGTVPAQIQSAQ